jgi:hypothetical protein
MTIPFSVAAKEADMVCTKFLYLVKPWAEVYGICKPLAEKGDLDAQVLIALLLILHSDKDGARDLGSQLLTELLAKGVDDAGFWLGWLKLNSQHADIKTALHYFDNTLGDYRVSALIASAVIYAEGLNKEGKDLAIAKDKLTEAFAIHKKKYVPSEIVKNDELHTSLHGDNYTKYLRGLKGYYESQDLISYIEKYGFDKSEIEKEAALIDVSQVKVLKHFYEIK